MDLVSALSRGRPPARTTMPKQLKTLHKRSPLQEGRQRCDNLGHSASGLPAAAHSKHPGSGHSPPLSAAFSRNKRQKSYLYCEGEGFLQINLSPPDLLPTSSRPSRLPAEVEKRRNRFIASACTHRSLTLDL